MIPRAWEVFDPRHGEPIRTVRFRFFARLICFVCPMLDYGRPGEGWVTQ